jgi:hypothetical protein
VRLGRTATLLIACGLVVSGQLVSGSAAAGQTADDPAPSDVTIAWADTTHQAIRVSWQEAADLPNKIAVRKVGYASERSTQFTSAGAPNEVSVPVEPLRIAGCGTFEIAVWIGTADGVTSAAGVSVPFDNRRAPAPVLLSFTPSGSGVIQSSWRWSGYSCADNTPDDPLDVPEPPMFQPGIRTGSGPYVPAGPPTVATQLSVSGNPPYELRVWSVNEWGYGATEFHSIFAERTALSAQVPATAVYLQPMAITGKVSLFDGADSRWLILQARDSSTSPWYEVTRTYQDLGDPGFRFTFNSPGTRSYRVIAPTRRNTCCTIQFGTTTASARSGARYRVVTARFGDSSASYGQRVAAYVQMYPALSVRSILERWDGTAWVGVKYVYTDGGTGKYSFTANTRGTTAYRFVIPTAMYNGRAFVTTTTPTFVLTTR